MFYEITCAFSPPLSLGYSICFIMNRISNNRFCISLWCVSDFSITRFERFWILWSLFFGKGRISLLCFLFPCCLIVFRAFAFSSNLILWPFSCSLLDAFLFLFLCLSLLGFTEETHECACAWQVVLARDRDVPFSPSASSSRTVSPIDPGLVVLKLFLHQWTPSAHFRREVRFPHTCLLVVVVEHVFARPFSQVENTFIVTSSSPSASSSCSSPSSSPSSPSTPASFSYTPRFSSPSCVRYLGVLTNAALTFADHHSNPSPETLAAIKSLRASAQNALFLYQSPARLGLRTTTKQGEERAKERTKEAKGQPPSSPLSRHWPFHFHQCQLPESTTHMNRREMREQDDEKRTEYRSQSSNHGLKTKERTNGGVEGERARTRRGQRQGGREEERERKRNRREMRSKLRSGLQCRSQASTHGLKRKNESREWMNEWIRWRDGRRQRGREEQRRDEEEQEADGRRRIQPMSFSAKQPRWSENDGKKGRKNEGRQEGKEEWMDGERERGTEEMRDEEQEADESGFSQCHSQSITSSHGLKTKKERIYG